MRKELIWVITVSVMICSIACVPMRAYDDVVMQLAQTRKSLSKAERRVELAAALENGELIERYCELEGRVERAESIAQGVNQIAKDLRKCRAKVAALEEKRKALQDAQTLTTPSVVESKIGGVWNGWNGDTLFRLLNGQVWEQVGAWVSVSVRIMPDVLIYQSRGGWMAQVEGKRRPIRVRRLK